MAFEAFMSFPYYRVGNYIFDRNYGGLHLVDDYKRDWPTNKILQLWYYYEQGLDDNAIKAVDVNRDLTNVKYLESVTPYKRAHIIWWLEAVQELAKSGRIDAEFYTGKDVATNPIEKTVRSLKIGLQNLTKGAKAGAAVAGIGVVLYLAWPLLVRSTRRRIAK